VTYRHVVRQKVVLVDKPLAFAELEIGQSHRMRTVGKDHATLVVDTVGLAMNAESLQVNILPAYGDLLKPVLRCLTVGKLASILQINQYATVFTDAANAGKRAR
jgi:hypothetical protein